ncbi:unnamed protein product [Knipowitschia caucasica]|uniref:Ig-like domain-containing protein n=1 Tax=Knipowitschia caucasica TaxID=637954 RepID=A0AAV2MIR8_KNICA
MGTERGLVWALLLLLHTAQDAEGDCDARKNNTCYGALGGTIEIQLMASGAKTNDKCRSVFNNTSGILNITNVTREDNGSYTLELFDNGKLTSHSQLNLLIEAPVTDVLLKQECLSKGVKKATCSSREGDRPEFSWTLNGLNLSNNTNVITLKQIEEGTLRCSVKNHISEESKEITIGSCGYIHINCTVNGTQILDWVHEANNTLCIEQTTTPSISSDGKISFTSQSVLQTSPTFAPAGCGHFSKNWPILVGVMVAILICGVVAVTCVLKKCKKKRDEEDNQELTYADVRILRQPGREPQPKSEEEVEYGQVKFSNQSPHASVAEDNVCIYSKVCR